MMMSVAAIMLAGLDASRAAQSAAAVVDTHVAAARSAAGQDHVGVFEAACAATSIRPLPGQLQPGTLPGRAPGQREGPPPNRDRWYVDPAKVFDNLYFVGERNFSSWA